jgi:hypothetical protein
VVLVGDARQHLFSVSASSPYFAKYAGASIENCAGAVIAASVPSLGGGVTTKPEKPESLSFSTPIAITQS